MYHIHYYTRQTERQASLIDLWTCCDVLHNTDNSRLKPQALSTSCSSFSMFWLFLEYPDEHLNRPELNSTCTDV